MHKLMMKIAKTIPFDMERMARCVSVRMAKLVTEPVNRVSERWLKVVAFDGFLRRILQ